MRTYTVQSEGKNMAEECIEKETRNMEYETDSRGVFGIRRLGLVTLVEGEMNKDSGKGTSSVTLVKTAKSTIVIDSGTPEVSERIRDGLQNVGVPIEKVNVLVTTHPEPNYTGNDHLFVHALQHIAREYWGRIKGATGRRVAIDTPCHWIDKYVKIVRMEFDDHTTMAILFHIPDVKYILEPGTADLAGKIIGIVGGTINSREDPEVREILESINKIQEKDLVRPEQIEDIKDLLLYCDYIIPGHGPMFPTREGRCR
jgi:glyoxylase-like metal-dependent hydrolase (beta-lactamase superfamily II)